MAEEIIITYDREKFEKGELNAKDLNKLIQVFESDIQASIIKCKQYYLGEQGDEDTVVCNHAKDIADTAAGYFLGNPITYKAKDDKDISILTDALEFADIDSVDQDNALMLSIAGRSYEYWYADEGEAELAVQALDPEHAFIVYDTTIVHKKLFGVYYYYKIDDSAQTQDPKTYVMTVTDKAIKNWVLNGDIEVESSEEPHNIGMIPLLEVRNNKFCVGDFQQQIPLIDAYNEMTGDRVKDKEQFIDSILVLYGAIMGDTEDETDEALNDLKKRKLLELDSDARAEYLTRTLDEGGMEVLRSALKEDIYTFSHVPNLTDKNFAGNSSGVAMEYKLLGLEMLTKTKERWYRRMLHDRLHVLQAYYGKKNQAIDPHNIEATFSRGLPKNIAELAGIVATLSGTVSKKTLISQLPFVQSPDDEIKAVEKENEEAIKRQQELFKEGNNEFPEELKKEEEIEEDEQ